MVEQSHDPSVLRAVAHPLRTRILFELSSGPLRAADLAERLGVPANRVSFHLRQLAKYDLIQDAPEAARDGRDRFWQRSSPAGISVQLDELADTPEGREAVRVWRRTSEDWAHEVVRSAYAERSSRPDGSDFVGIGEVALRLTGAEAEALNDEIAAVLDAWREKASDGADGDAYLWLSMLQRFPETLS